MGGGKRPSVGYDRIPGDHFFSECNLINVFEIEYIMWSFIYCY